MSHLRAVKSEKHTALAEQHNMRHFYLSAKTGDNVSTCFYKVASELSGVTLTKPEVMPTATTTATATATATRTRTPTLTFWGPACIQYVSLLSLPSGIGDPSFIRQITQSRFRPLHVSSTPLSGTGNPRESLTAADLGQSNAG
jgi:hypothetical protein